MGEKDNLAEVKGAVILGKKPLMPSFRLAPATTSQSFLFRCEPVASKNSVPVIRLESPRARLAARTGFVENLWLY